MTRPTSAWNSKVSSPSSTTSASATAASAIAREVVAGTKAPVVPRKGAAAGATLWGTTKAPAARADATRYAAARVSCMVGMAVWGEGGGGGGRRGGEPGRRRRDAWEGGRNGCGCVGEF